MLFSYGYNIETCKIIEATFLTLRFCHMRDFLQVKGGGAWPKWPNGKYASGFLRRPYKLQHSRTTVRVCDLGSKLLARAVLERSHFI